EDLSTLMDLVAPHTIDDVTIIMLGNKLNRFASHAPALYQEIIIDRFAKLGKIAATSALDINTWLREMIDLGRYGALELENNDIEKLQTTLPERTREWILKDIEKTVRDLWSRRNEEDVTSAMEFYQEVYTWLNSPQVAKGWSGIFQSYMPDWQTWLLSDWYGQEDKEEEQPLSMEEIFQQIKPSEKREEAPAPAPEASPAPAPETAPPKKERPVTEELSKKLMIYDPNTRKKDFEVGIGDKIFNQSARQILMELKDEHGLTKNQVNDYSVGTIKEIRPDGSLLVTVEGAEDPFDEQIWSQDDKLWGSRESGQRVVNT
ncbi:MAG: hypothetical protein ACWGQW_21175, partial [bacterium]